VSATPAEGIGKQLVAVLPQNTNNWHGGYVDDGVFLP